MSALAEAPAPPPAGAGRSPQEEAWWFAEAEAVAVMGTVNVAVARLVAAVRGLLDTDGWEGIGIQSPEHWLCWKAGIVPPPGRGPRDDRPPRSRATGVLGGVRRRAAGGGRHGPHRPPGPAVPGRRGRRDGPAPC